MVGRDCSWDMLLVYLCGWLGKDEVCTSDGGTTRLDGVDGGSGGAVFKLCDGLVGKGRG